MNIFMSYHNLSSPTPSTIGQRICFGEFLGQLLARLRNKADQLGCEIGSFSR